MRVSSVINNRRLLFIVNVDWFFVSHRLPIAIEAVKQGYDVHLAGYLTNCSEELTENGISVHHIPLSRGRAGIFRELFAIISIFRLIGRLRPNIVHLVTIKPVLFGGIVSRFFGVRKVVAAISGLGYLYVAKGKLANLRRLVVGAVYKLALNHHSIIMIFQNGDDKRKLEAITKRKFPNSLNIPGSGVDLSDYAFSEEIDSGPIVVSMVSRLLKDKGVLEFIEAAEILHSRGEAVRFQLVGSIDLDNPASLTEKELHKCGDLPNLTIVGFKNDISTVFRDSHIAVLPSYREGFPKVLMEAAACGRAVVTTDVPGCRDAIIDRITGLLVPCMDAVSLANAIQQLAQDDALRKNMGIEGRKLAERKFGIENIVSQHLILYGMQV